MKKQILIFAAAFVMVAFVSCSKEKIETPTTNLPTEEAGAMNKGSLVPIFINPLNVGLLGRYEFNSTLKDTTGKLSDAVSTVNRVIYTTDRKGVANSAIRFNAAYGLNILGVPLDTNESVSVWVKKEIYAGDYHISFVEGSHSLTLHQFEDKFQGAGWNGINGQYVISGSQDNNWHHLVVTRDKVSLKFYIDAVLIGSSPTPAGYTPPATTSDYNIGYGYNLGYKYWQGSMDDLRIYKRVLSTSDIVKLKNL
jgi:hypothetical protein